MDDTRKKSVRLTDLSANDLEKVLEMTKSIVEMYKGSGLDVDTLRQLFNMVKKELAAKTTETELYAGQGGTR